MPIVANYTSLAHSDGYRTAGALKCYIVGAFADRNGRPWRSVGRAGHDHQARVEVVAGWRGRHAPIFLCLSSTGLPAAIVDALQDLAIAEGKPLPLAIGEAAGLDDAPVAEDSGRLGTGAPFVLICGTRGQRRLFPQFSARDEVSHSLFLGHGGFPQQRRPFIESLYASLYQPWVFLYPSGCCLQSPLPC